MLVWFFDDIGCKHCWFSRKKVEGKSFTSKLTTIDKAVDYKVRLNLPEQTYEKCAIQVLKIHNLASSDITDDCDINRIEHYVDVPGFDFPTYLVNTSDTLYLCFDSQGGSYVKKQEVKYNTVAKRPENPTKNGFTFVDWYTEPECANVFDFAKPVIQQQTIFAKWKENCGGDGGGDKPGGIGETSPSSSLSSSSASTGDINLLVVYALCILLFASCMTMFVIWFRNNKTNKS